MSFYSQATTLHLWYAQPVLESAVAAVLWRRNLHKQFPVFFAYLLIQVAIFAITLPLYGRPDVYAWFFYLYWTFEAGNAVLGFKIIHEIFLDVFRPYHALKDLGTPAFKWAGVVMLMVAAVMAASNSPHQEPVFHAIATLERSVRVVQVGLIFFLLIFSRYLGVSRKQLSFGIALGFGFVAGAELLLYAMYSGKFIGHGHLELLNLIFYDLSNIAWLAYAVLGTAVKETVANPLRTQRWERGLADLHPAVASNSLIPMFEGMVERALSRHTSLDSEEEPRGKDPGGTARVKSAAAGSKDQM